MERRYGRQTQPEMAQPPEIANTLFNLVLFGTFTAGFDHIAGASTGPLGPTDSFAHATEEVAFVNNNVAAYGYRENELQYHR